MEGHTGGKAFVLWANLGALRGQNHEPIIEVGPLTLQKGWKMAWVLFLNDMRWPNVETVRPVVRAESKEALVAFLDREREPSRDSGEHEILHTTDAVAQNAGGVVVERVAEHQWVKTFRRGGPLEWYNEPWEFEPGRHFRNAGTREDWMREAGENYDADVGRLPSV